MRIIVLPIFILAISLSATPALAEEQLPSIQAPETIEDAQQFGLQILQGLPIAMQDVWRTQVLPLWGNMWSIAKNLWDKTIYSIVRGLWDQALALFGQEVENRKSLFEAEFQKEKIQLKQEIEEQIPESGKTLWNLIKGFLPQGGE